jgi:hypothetical protein
MVFYQTQPEHATSFVTLTAAKHDQFGTIKMFQIPFNLLVPFSISPKQKRGA